MLLRHLSPALGWALLILVLCGLPGSAIPSYDLLDLLNFDKFVHLSLFLMQVLLLCIAFRKQHSVQFLQSHAIPAAVVTGALYGITTEYLQLVFFTGRSFDYLDMIANLTGSVAGAGAWFLIYPRLRKAG